MLDMSLWRRSWGVLLFLALLDHSNDSGEEAVDARPGGARTGCLSRFHLIWRTWGMSLEATLLPEAGKRNATPGTHEGKLGDAYG